jgi:hypothetical protein
LHERLEAVASELHVSQQARQRAEARLATVEAAMECTEHLAEQLGSVQGALHGRATRALRQQRDQAVHTAHRLRMRLAETEVAATQHARVSTHRAGELQVRARFWRFVLLRRACNRCGVNGRLDFLHAGLCVVQ